MGRGDGSIRRMLARRTYIQIASIQGRSQVWWCAPVIPGHTIGWGFAKRCLHEQRSTNSNQRVKFPGAPPDSRSSQISELRVQREILSQKITTVIKNMLNISLWPPHTPMHTHGHIYIKEKREGRRRKESKRTKVNRAWHFVAFPLILFFFSLSTSRRPCPE